MQKCHGSYNIYIAIPFSNHSRNSIRGFVDREAERLQGNVYMQTPAHAQSDCDNVLLPRSAAAPQFGLPFVCVCLVSRRLCWAMSASVLCCVAVLQLYISVQLQPRTPWDAGTTRSSTPAESRDGSMFMVCLLLAFTICLMLQVIKIY